MSDWIAEAQQRVDDATTGPWQVCPTPSEGAHGHAITAEGITEEPIVAVDWGCPVIEDATFIAAARTDLPKALGALRAVLDLHRAFRVYDECGHRHESEDEPGVVDVDDVGLTCEDGYVNSICARCCTGDGYQTEACATEHQGPCWPCPTVVTVRTATA